MAKACISAFLVFQLATAQLSAPPLSAVSADLVEQLSSDAGVTCPVRSYYWGPWKGKHYCVSCPTGSTSDGCTACKADPSGSSCRESNCPRGKYYVGHAETQQTCHSCPSGYWQSMASMPGCYRCPAGMFQPNKGFYSCYNCPTGRFQTERGSVECGACNSCQKGKFGTTSGFGATTSSACICKSCGVGKFSPEGQTACTECPKGRFQPTKGHFSCYFCPTGKFQDKQGSTTCTTCPSGTSTPRSLVLPVSKNQCSEVNHLWCNAGKYLYYHKTTGTVHCVNCPVGMFGKISEGYKYGGQCFGCPTGRYQPTVGKHTCNLCPSGSVQTNDKTACVVEYPDHEDVVTGTPAPTPEPKPEDCSVSAWEPIGTCTKTCGGGGLQKVSRTVTSEAKDGGKVCPPLTQFETCGEASCPIHCKVSQFTAWSACSRTCGAGVQTQTRTVLVQPNDSGEECPQLSDIKSCGALPACPIDCMISAWVQENEWNSCSKSCGTGTQVFTRFVSSLAKNGGAGCPALTKNVQCNTQQCPQDCVLSEWRRWSVCSKSCNGGTRKRSRQIKQQPQFGGQCPEREESEACEEGPCPVDCRVDYGPFSICSASCGSGFRTRQGTVTRQRQHGGKLCPQLANTEYCNKQPCPVDCATSSWRAWNLCSASCGGKGTHERARSILISPEFGGKACPPSSQVRDCSAEPCPIDCVMLEWSEWTSCSKTCEKGTIRRARQVKTPAQYGGTPCQDQQEIAECDLGSCPQHCEVSAWNEWTQCAKTCGGGVRTRTRHVETYAHSGGYVCPALRQNEECNSHLCPSDCEMGAWSAFSPCTVTCGSGTKMRSRPMQQKAQEGGKGCSPAQDVQSCKPEPCPIDCVVGRWSIWSACSTSCGEGSKTRSRSISRAALFGGKQCPPSEAESLCDVDDCPVDCEVSSWTVYGDCSVTCGSGHKSRTRRITVHSNGGHLCPGLLQSATCSFNACPIDCIMSAWDDWGACSQSCAGGRQTRYRSIERKDGHNGKPCGAVSESQDCNIASCPVDCSFSGWENWSDCSVSCEEGTMSRTRSVIDGPQFGGRACDDPQRSHTESVSCDDGPCPVHCSAGSWASWSACSKTCGKETMERRREILRRPEFGGFTCPHVVESESCAHSSCPRDCEVSGWAAVGECTVTCGVGHVRHERTVKTYDTHGGTPCPSLVKEKLCHRAECPVDCVLGNWGSFDQCSRSCGTGWQTHFREEKVAAAFGGEQCEGAKEEAKKCNTAPCAVDCELSRWGEYGACSSVCGAGNQTRARAIVVHPQFGGKPCGPKTSMKYCNPICPVDCRVSEWGNFSPCSNSCGSGFRIRTRTIAAQSEDGGQACPALTDQEPCLDRHCPIHCEVDGWKSWSTCTLTCGSGTKVRSRVILTHATRGGYACPSLTETVSCGTAPCAQDCKVDIFSAWTECSQSCGVGDLRGTQMRTRAVKTQPMNGGKTCPALKEVKKCGVRCEEDCAMTNWGSWHACSRSCGVGSQSRYRSIVQPGWPATKACPDVFDERSCTGPSCPLDCEVAEWSSWGVCSHSCASTGSSNAPVKTRTREITRANSLGGVGCPAVEQRSSCNANHCPVDCQLSTWFESLCDKSCGGGIRQLTRVVDVPASNGGSECAASLARKEGCNSHACPADCSVTEWSDWSDCSLSCNDGTKTRTRTIVTEAADGGSCPALFEQSACNEGPCPVHCVIGSWSVWSECSKTCGGGTMTRSRPVLSHAENGGYQCPFTADDQSCSPDACPVDCVLGSWGHFGECSVTCGTGLRHKTRSVVMQPAHGGKSCQATTESEACAVDCSVDCAVSLWAGWGKCNVECGTGHQSRRRAVTTQPFFDGKPCPDTTEHRTCNTQDCTPVPSQSPTNFPTGAPTIRHNASPCTFGERVPLHLFERATTRVNWRQLNDAFSENEGKLEGNMQMLNSGPWKITMDVEGNPNHSTDYIEVSIGNSFLGAYRGGRDSNTVTYETGSVSDFEYKLSWTTPGEYSWHKHVDIKNAVAVCVREERDCQVSAWGEWDSCTVSCDGGTHNRQRTVTAQAGRHGGKVCPQLHDSQPCNTGRCPFIKTFQAETSKSIKPGSGLVIDNKFGGYKGAGYVQFSSPAKVKWSVTVPVSGRYKVDFRYQVNDHSNVAVETENLRIDHQESEALHFERTSGWTETSTHVTLYKGKNALSISTTTSFGPNLDQITVTEETTLERCVPGEVVPLRFVADATQRDFIDGNGRIEAGELSGSFGGWIDLQKLGMWDIQITLKGGDLGSYATPKAWKQMEQGYTTLTLGGKQIGPVHNSPDLEIHPLTFQTSNAHLKYKFQLEDFQVQNAAARMQVLDGKAVCAGCPHVRCEVKGHNSARTLHITHMSPRQAEAKGIEILPGRHKHSCSINKKYNFCSCRCDAETLADSETSEEMTP